MGQKIHPTGFRIPVIEPWRSRWYASKKDFKKFLLQDKQIRDHVFKEFGSAGIPRIEIERTSEAVNVVIYTSRPGVLVGRKGVRVEELKKELQKITEGGFGDCERCGEPIADKRLDAVPDARYCIECQRAIEEEERTAAR
jgi:ribosomal protein S3